MILESYFRNDVISFSLFTSKQFSPVSHPVKLCMPIRDLQNGPSNVSQILLMSVKSSAFCII